MRPVSEVALEDLLSEISDLVAGDKVSSRGQITGALGWITGIARELAVDTAGNRLDPVLEYDADTNPNAPTSTSSMLSSPFYSAWRLDGAQPAAAAS